MGLLISIFVTLKSQLIELKKTLIKNDKTVEPEIQELMTLSAFSYDEVIRIKGIFYKYSNNENTLSLDQFLLIPCIVNNPLSTQISRVFTFDNATSNIDLKTFITKLSIFNCIGKRGEKLHTLYQIQDIDNDGQISKQDLYDYIQKTTFHKLSDEEINILVTNTLEECSSHPNNEYINFADFAKVVAPTDFHIKLRLSI